MAANQSRAIRKNNDPVGNGDSRPCETRDIESPAVTLNVPTPTADTRKHAPRPQNPPFRRRTCAAFALPGNR